MRLAFIKCLLTLMVVLTMSACDKTPPANPDDDRPLVVATTTMLADLAAQIGGDAVRVEGIMRPGGDPHLYQPRPRDARLIARSQLVIKSGLKLEGWIDDLLDNAGGSRPAIVASDGIEPIRMAGFASGVDPHFWFDLRAWRIATDNVGAALVNLVGQDTQEGRAIQARLTTYQRQVDDLHTWVQATLATIPEGQRVLATSHDAFNYFGRAYAIEVVAAQGVSTEQQASQRDLANIIEVVRRRNLPAVFIETSVNPALIQQVAREAGIRVAGPLYSDSIGAADGPASTFLGTVVENIRMITEALGGTFEPFAPETS